MASGEMYGDLHMHSYYSDGRHSPSELVERAATAGIDVISLTDHDNYRGIAEAIEAGRKHWIEVIPGAEISSRFDGREMHILCYYIDTEDRDTIDLLDMVCATRRSRIEKMIEGLQRQGLDISFEDLAIPHPKTSLGRLHLAEAMVRKGLVKDNNEAFKLYIGDNSDVYEPHQSANAAEVIKVMLASGALPVLAHPGEHFPEEILAKLVELGLVGIEGLYPNSHEKTRRQILAWARHYDLILTGGSDFHYDGGHIQIGNPKIKSISLEALKAKHAALSNE